MVRKTYGLDLAIKTDSVDQKSDGDDEQEGIESIELDDQAAEQVPEKGTRDQGDRKNEGEDHEQESQGLQDAEEQKGRVRVCDFPERKERR